LHFHPLEAPYHSREFEDSDTDVRTWRGIKVVQFTGWAESCFHVISAGLLFIKPGEVLLLGVAGDGGTEDCLYSEHHRMG
jgi:hypothetical protein